jgi:hypothetical protein
VSNKIKASYQLCMKNRISKELEVAFVETIGKMDGNKI